MKINIFFFCLFLLLSGSYNAYSQKKYLFRLKEACHQPADTAVFKEWYAIPLVASARLLIDLDKRVISFASDTSANQF